MGVFDDLAAPGARLFFGAAEGIFRTLGLSDAAANLRRYRSAQGGTLNFSDSQIAKHEPILEAEDTNRTRFETATFIAKTEKPGLNARLRSLRDGEVFTFKDDFNRGLYSPEQNRLSQATDIVSNPATYLAFGRGEILSPGNFTARRDGRRLIIRGQVMNGFDPNDKDNVFDFNPGQPGGISAGILERRREARPFSMQFDRRQQVEAEAVYGPDGALTLKKVTWGAVR